MAMESCIKTGIQPADQTAPMLFFYETSAVVSKQMKTAVEARLQESEK
jgi:hypothetical protein